MLCSSFITVSLVNIERLTVGTCWVGGGGGGYWGEGCHSGEEVVWRRLMHVDLWLEVWGDGGGGGGTPRGVEWARE